jgi:two-component system, chemotaxis family, chemotaxis protein CheY
VHIKRILIIDDSPVARILLKKCIGEGFEIYEAGTGEEGLDLYKSINTDITFLDLTMPGMGGLEVLKELLIIDPKARVIVISADRQSSTIKEAISIGAYTVLKKPPRQDRIHKTLHSIEMGEKAVVEDL